MGEIWALGVFLILAGFAFWHGRAKVLDDGVWFFAFLVAILWPFVLGLLVLLLPFFVAWLAGSASASRR